MTLGVLGCALLLASPVASAAQASYSGASGECFLVVLERTLTRTEPALRCSVSHSGTVQVASSDCTADGCFVRSTGWVSGTLSPPGWGYVVGYLARVNPNNGQSLDLQTTCVSKVPTLGTGATCQGTSGRLWMPVTAGKCAQERISAQGEILADPVEVWQPPAPYVRAAYAFAYHAVNFWLCRDAAGNPSLGGGS